MRVTDMIEESARLGRRLAEIDKRLRIKDIEKAERESLEVERRAVIQVLALKNAIEE